MKRQRGRGHRPGGGHQHNHQHQHQNPNRSMESSGPEGGKVRGPAAMIHERYLQLARDAAGSSGDRVLSENYLQHADHYFRLWRASQPAAPPPQMNDRYADEGGGDREDAGMEGGDEGEGYAKAGDQPDVEFPQGQQPQQQQFDRDGDQRGRGRGRRTRYRPNEGEGGGEGENREAREGEAREGGEREGGVEVREERPQRQPRERQARQPRDEAAGPEGFSNGPKPAFLRGGD